MKARKLKISGGIVLFLGIIFLSLTYSFYQKVENEINQNKAWSKGGIAFTFDDNDVHSWYSHRSLFKKYNIHCTFFVKRPQQLNPEEINMLKTLKADGHEIGCHGYHHIDASAYLAKKDTTHYLNYEIKPAMNLFSSWNIPVNSFAYPFGSSTQESDTLLLKRFQKLRKATYNKFHVWLYFIDKIFTKKNGSVMNAMGLDCNYNISLFSFKTGIYRAFKNNEILVVYCHSINNSGKPYSVSPQYLEKVFQLCQEVGMNSLLFREI